MIKSYGFTWVIWHCLSKIVTLAEWHHLAENSVNTNCLPLGISYIVNKNCLTWVSDILSMDCLFVCHTSSWYGLPCLEV